ncbi:MAG: 4Fe-4S binding protein [Rhizobacter sp.]|nr:4Fe-4S binding protein [Chlorobiales bacterium]
MSTEVKLALDYEAEQHRKRNKVVYKRLAVQGTMIVVHVALIKFAIPNVLWAVLGLMFWGGLIYAAARSGRWVCASICWLGGIQDVMYRWAKKRVGFSPRITQIAVLVVLVVWVPLAWLLTGGETMMSAETPLQNPLNVSAGESLLMQAGHFLILIVAGLTVTVFGPRGLCHYFCPFGLAVGFMRDVRLKKKNGERLLQPLTITATKKA